MARPLILGPTEYAALANIRALAERNPVNAHGLLERLGNPETKAAHQTQMIQQSTVVPVAWGVTFSIETGHPGGTARHLSVASLIRGRLPSTTALWLIAIPLGFTGCLEACDNVWEEQLAGRDGIAVNVIQLFDTAAAMSGRPN